MGMDLYNSSPAARAVWEGADAHLLDVRCPKYAFSHPAGLLFATQFAQIALRVVITKKAAFEDMRVKGFVQKDCAFAGHPLGVLSLRSLTFFTFLP